jgi:hypothetical protein
MIRKSVQRFSEKIMLNQRMDSLLPLVSSRYHMMIIIPGGRHA